MPHIPPVPPPDDRSGVLLDQGIRLLWAPRGQPPPPANLPSAPGRMAAQSDIRVVGAFRLRRRPRPLGDVTDGEAIEPAAARLPNLGDLLGAL